MINAEVSTMVLNYCIMQRTLDLGPISIDGGWTAVLNVDVYRCAGYRGLLLPRGEGLYIAADDHSGTHIIGSTSLVFGFIP